tara:strand:+ start:1732 stop:2220 length:489 start_codon:yes stop_codon:yes gene_type:complete
VTIINKKLSDYPVIARYTSKYSVNNSSIEDVEIAYNNNVIGVNSYRFAVGDIGLCISDYDLSSGGFHIFSYKVLGQAPSDKKEIWRKKGGRLWKYNYTIEATSSIIVVSKQDFQNITDIEYKGNGHTFNGHKSHKYKMTGKTKNLPKGQARVKLYSHLSSRT